jgi:hypothetical protein
MARNRKRQRQAEEQEQGVVLEDGRQALVAIRYSQVRSDARFSSYLSYDFHARSNVSCTRSSASCNDPDIR